MKKNRRNVLNEDPMTRVNGIDKMKQVLNERDEEMAFGVWEDSEDFQGFVPADEFTYNSTFKIDSGEFQGLIFNRDGKTYIYIERPIKKKPWWKNLW